MAMANVPQDSFMQAWNQQRGIPSSSQQTLF